MKPCDLVVGITCDIFALRRICFDVGWTLWANRNPSTLGMAYNAENKTCSRCIHVKAKKDVIAINIDPLRVGYAHVSAPSAGGTTLPTALFGHFDDVASGVS